MKHLRIFTALLLSVVLAVSALAKIGTAYQMQLGNPTEHLTGADKVSDPFNHRHYLIADRAQYALDYNDTLGIPNWVSWDLTVEDIGTTGRSDAWAADSSLPVGFHRVLKGDYSGSGYDRGHMCPSADRTVTRADNIPLFLMTNMVPQSPNNNQGYWALLEDYCRGLVKASPSCELLITCGPAGYTKYGSLTTGVAIPDYVWKIIVVVPLGEGTALERITKDCRVIAVMTPNKPNEGTTPEWTDFITTVASIEVATGLKFFTALPTDVADALRVKLDSGTGTSTGGGSGGGGSVVLPTAPVITSQPINKSATVGASIPIWVTATTTAEAGELTYQWFRNGSPISAATNASALTYKLTIDPVSFADAGTYYAEVSNEIGTVTTNVITLTVNAASSGGGGTGTPTTGPAGITGSKFYWNFGTASAVATPEVTNAPGLSIGAIQAGNVHAATELLSTTAGSTGGNGTYTGASGAYNAGMVATVGLLSAKPLSNFSYFALKLSTDSDTIATVTSVSLGSRSTATGPKVLGVYSSANNFGTPLCTFPLVSGNVRWTWYSGSTSETLLPNTSNQELRIYGYDGVSTNAYTSGNWRIDDLVIGVSVSSVTPAIQIQPADLSVELGALVSLEVVATSPVPLSYQWRKNGQPITDNPSATSMALVIDSAGAADIASYDCIVSNTYKTVTTREASLQVSQSYAVWVDAHALPSGRAAEADDADGDGVTNLVEYALGLNPVAPDSQLLPACTVAGGQATLRYSRPRLAVGVNYAVETSTDLINWSQLTALSSGGTVNAEAFSVSVPATEPRRFFRLALGTFRTVPVGYSRVVLSGSGALTPFAIALDETQAPLAGIRSGFVDTFTSTTIVNAAGAWTGNLADPAAPWALRFTSGLAAGLQFDVKANTVSTITLSGVDLGTLGLMAGTDRFELVPLETLGTLFGGSTLQGGASSTVADIVQVRSGATWLAYFYDPVFGHWRRTIGTAVNCDNVVIRTEAALLVQRRGTSVLPLDFTGRVRSTAFRAQVNKAGSSVISLGYPVDTTLAALGLQNLLPGWRTGTADQLYLHNGSAWIAYYYTGTEWVRSSDKAAAGALPLPGSAALQLQRSGTTAGTVEFIRKLSF